MVYLFELQTLMPIEMVADFSYDTIKTFAEGFDLTVSKNGLKTTVKVRVDKPIKTAFLQSITGQLTYLTMSNVAVQVKKLKEGE